MFVTILVRRGIPRTIFVDGEEVYAAVRHGQGFSAAQPLDDDRACSPPAIGMRQIDDVSRKHGRSLHSQQQQPEGHLCGASGSAGGGTTGREVAADEHRDTVDRLTATSREGTNHSPCGEPIRVV